MKNRFVRLLRMGLPGLVLAALAGCAAPVGPEETPTPETQVYTVGGGAGPAGGGGAVHRGAPSRGGGLAGGDPAGGIRD